MRHQKLEELKTYIDELQTIKKVKSKDERKFLSIETYDCYLNNGKKIRREKLLKNNSDGDAAIILPLTKENNTILTIQPRVFTKRSVGIELPAGYIEKKEDKYKAALRELQEETGYVPKQIKLLTSYYQDQGCMASYNYSFIALGCEKLYDQNLDPGEYVRYFECSYDETLELIDLGYIEDANSIITLEKAKKYVKRS